MTTTPVAISGPLAGTRVLELGGIGPVQFTGMALADLGADVVRIERPGHGSRADSSLSRGRSLIAADLHDEADLAGVLDLARDADIAVEGFRPGTAERLGIGPQDLARINRALVYGRMSGWGRTGPLAAAPGHDINYIALSGALISMRRPGGVPVVSPGFVGDFGGAGMSLTVGLLAAVLQARASGLGQVVDCSITAGSAWISAALLDQLSLGPEAAGLATGQAPFYNVYQCGDGGFVAVGALEPPFYCAFLEVLGLDASVWGNQFATELWPERIGEAGAIFAGRDRLDWVSHPLSAQACITPVLSMDEARDHQQNRAAGLFTSHGDITQPNPAPQFSRTPGHAPGPADSAALDEITRRWRNRNNVQAQQEDTAK